MARLWLIAATCIPCLTFATIAVAAEAPAGAENKCSQRRQAEVLIKAVSGRTLRTFIAYPDASETVHAVIIVHENRGLTAWEREVAETLAAAGYLAVVPDLLSEMGPGGGGSESFESLAAARDGVHNLTPEQVAADLDAVVDYAGDQPESDKKTAVVGFGWGGTQAFRYATHNSRIDAVMVFDGAAPTDEQLQKLAVPVFGFYGENDVRIAGEVPKVRARLKALEKAYQPVTYPGAGHGFMRAGAAQDAKPADRKAREEAWERLRALLAAF